MAFCNLHDDLLENPWFMGLPDESARTFLHLLAYAARGRGRILSGSISFVASRIGRKESSLRSLLAKSEGRIYIEGNEIVFRDWLQWNKPQDLSTDRVRKYREMKRVSTVSPETLHETSDETDETPQRREEKRREEKNPPPPFPQFVTDWNEFAKPLKLPICTKWTPKRAKLLAAKLRIPEFAAAVETGELWKKIKSQPFLTGQNSRGWTVTIDYIIERADGWIKILEQSFLNKIQSHKKETPCNDGIVKFEIEQECQTCKRSKPCCICPDNA